MTSAVQVMITDVTGSGLKPSRNRRAIRQGLLIASIMAAIAVCEYIFAYRDVAYGIGLSLALTILLCAFLALRTSEDGVTASVETLTMVPLYILFTSSLPWFFLSQDYLLPAVYTCILGLCFLHIYQKGLSFREIFGLPEKRKIAPYLLFGLVGVPLSMVEYFILLPAPYYPEFTVKHLLVNMFYMVFFVGLGEELLFRGLIQRNLGALFGWKWGLVGASLLFSIMHLTWRSVPEMIFVFVAGMVFGIFYIRTGSLLSSIMIHGVNNAFLVAVYPYVFK